MFFVMKAAGEPRNDERWFDGFEDGLAFEADDFIRARIELDNRCLEAGTIVDPDWAEKGPYPLEVPITALN